MDAEEADSSLDQLEFLYEIQQRTRRESLIGGDLIALSRAIKLLIPITVYDNDADRFVEVSLSWNFLIFIKCIFY